MKRSLTLLALAGLSMFIQVHAERPNIIFFIADDMLLATSTVFSRAKINI